LELTQGCTDTLLDLPSVAGQRAGDVLQAMSLKYGVPGATFRVAMCLPIAHSHLLAREVWKAALVPLARGRVRSGLGLYLAPQLSAPAGEQDVVIGHADIVAGLGDNPDGDFLRSQERLMFLANQLRRLLAFDNSQQLRAEIFHLQARRDAMMFDRVRCSRRVFLIEQIVNCVLLSAVVRSATDIIDAVLLALRVAIPDDDIRAIYEDKLRSFDHPIPSPNTIVRHRLTLGMGFLRWQAEVVGELLDDPGGVVTWRQVDSSPQGGWDWVIHGRRLIAGRDVVHAYKCALDLINIAHQDDKASLPRARECATYLDSAMRLEQGAPTAVGSGKGSLRRKIRAVYHSERLGSRSWPEASQLLASTVAWCGDLGVESGFAGFCAPASKVMGPWIQNELMEDLLILILILIFNVIKRNIDFASENNNKLNNKHNTCKYDQSQMHAKKR